MPWRKLGRIYTPDGQRGWAQSHASVPIADHVSENRYRIYFTARDDGNRSHVGWCEININNPEKILAESEDPVLAPGKLGAFDMDGVMAITPSMSNAPSFPGARTGSSDSARIFSGLLILISHQPTCERLPSSRAVK